MRRGIGLACLACAFLSACGVEPEKRAYPLTVSLDTWGDVYEVRYGMAQLASVTGQGKDPGGSGRQELSFCGENFREIQEIYDRSQQYYLDTGHVQVILLGEGLLDNRGMLERALEELEEDRMLGSGCYVFSCVDTGELMELEGTAVKSLGEYLAGIYENRPEGAEEESVTLQEVYSAWHRDGEMPRLPKVSVGENGLPCVEKLD